ncbi:hypothetical protein KY285_007558 [Solanum tuberosum]|nr:hypothetical protein KY285_007558 [Solanum tuberosum]
MSTLIECECIEGKVKYKSQVSELLQQQEVLNRKMKDVTTLVDIKELEITSLEALLQRKKEQSQGPSPSTYG